MNKMKIYMDSCCFNRPFDDLTQSKIYEEAEAVKRVIELAKNGKITIISSQFVKYEIESIRLQDKRNNVLSFFHCDVYYTLTEHIADLARHYQTFNLKTFDSLHLATAEINEVDYLLSTDKDFIKFAERFSHKTKVINPCKFLEEEYNNAT